MFPEGAVRAIHTKMYKSGENRYLIAHLPTPKVATRSEFQLILE